jgi:hypothetical protein
MERSIERLFLFVKMDYASKRDDFVPASMNFNTVKNSDSAHLKIFLDFKEDICNYPNDFVVSIRTVITIYGFGDIHASHCRARFHHTQPDHCAFWNRPKIRFLGLFFLFTVAYACHRIDHSACIRQEKTQP